MDRDLLRLLWYVTHCADCGDWLGREMPQSFIENGNYGLCVVCDPCGSRPECMKYRLNPPEWIYQS